MIKNPTVPVIVEPRGLDLILNEINVLLVTRLTWLNLAFGKSEQLQRFTDTGTETFPGLYIGGGYKVDYINLLPDSHFGNYAYWDFEDGQENLKTYPGNVFLVANFKLVFWFDYRDLYTSDYERRTLENVKAEVNEFFRTTKFSEGNVVEVERFFERPENVYQGYDYKNVDKQFKMRPYGSLAITGRIRYLERSKCFTDQPALPSWVTPGGSEWVIP